LKNIKHIHVDLATISKWQKSYGVTLHNENICCCILSSFSDNHSVNYEEKETVGLLQKCKTNH